jgi:hypothetical protein
MSGMQSRKFDPSEKDLAPLFSELDHRIRNLFRRLIRAWDCVPERPDNRQPLRPEHFPLGARGKRRLYRTGDIALFRTADALLEHRRGSLLVVLAAIAGSAGGTLVS